VLKLDSAQEKGQILKQFEAYTKLWHSWASSPQSKSLSNNKSQKERSGCSLLSCSCWVILCWMQNTLWTISEVCSYEFI